MLAVHSDSENGAAERFLSGPGHQLARYSVVRQKGHSETVGNGVNLFRQEFDSTADPFTAKRQSLYLTRRGGKGRPNFVSPILGGATTTCGEWTRPMLRRPDGSIVKGFMKASVAVVFCPVECPYCYLNMPYADGMDVALNWEDLADELQMKWRLYPYPINFGETSGLVEYDEWFTEADGSGSLVQFVIDACAAAKVTPFFLTEVGYPQHLRFEGKVQVGISLMPEPVRQWLAPNGSPAEELLYSLERSWSAGAIDPVVRLTTIWQRRDLYADFLSMMHARLGTTGWRLTLDILRFTPVTASLIAKRYPEAAQTFAGEIVPDGNATLAELAREARRSAGHVKKIRPPAERQAEIFLWFRQRLDDLGCADVMLTPCKGDPDELAPLARLKIINSMPCACYGLKLRQEKPVADKSNFGERMPN